MHDQKCLQPNCLRSISGDIAFPVLPREGVVCRATDGWGSGKGEALEIEDILVFSRPIVRYLPSKGKVQLLGPVMTECSARHHRINIESLAKHHPVRRYLNDLLHILW